MSSLPPGWGSAKVGEISESVKSGFASGDHNRDGIGLPHLRPMNIGRDGRLSLDDLRYVQDSNGHRLEVGDVLFNNTNSAELVGKTTWIDTERDLAFSNHMTRVRVVEGVSAEFIARQLHHLWSTGVFQVLCNNHVSQASISARTLADEVELVVAPIAEQKRIVAKIEELTARSRRAKDALDAVPPLLDQLRQSILAAAFRGDLTADWRAKNPDVERSCADFSRRSLDPQPKRKKAARSRTQTENNEARTVPQGWRMARLSDVAEVQLGQRRAPEYAGETQYPYIRAANITWRGLDLSDVKSMGFADPKALMLEPGDVLLTEASGSPTEVGKPALWRGELEGCCFQATVLRLRSNTDLVLPEWLYYSNLADAALGNFAAMAPGVGILHLTSGRMRDWPIPVPSLEEQREICQILQQSLMRIDANEERVAALASMQSSLNESLLAKAFRGELVPQDPTDEPASVLLDRIRAARTTDPPTKRPRKTKSPAPPEPAPASKPIRVPTQPQLLLDPHTLQEQVVTALWPLGPLDKETAVRKAAESLRTAGHVDFQRLRADGPLYTQILTAIRSALKTGQLDRPTRGYVRACKPDALAYTPDDWRHALVASLGPDPIDREQAIRNAAQWAREQLGLEFSRLRADGHIAEGLRSAITSAIRRGEIIGHAKRISRPA